MEPAIRIEDLNVHYGDFHALHDLNLSIMPNRITAFIGPSGCGKTTLLKTIDRMLDLIDGVRVTGRILFDGKNLLDPDVELITLRKRIGMVFQRPNPFPLSIFGNVAYGPRVHGNSSRRQLEEIVERSLGAVKLWDDFKDRLDHPALLLSTEQQQRLCIARLVAVEPEVLLMDEPCSALDPISTMHVEELMRDLKRNYTIVIVTHNMQQAARISDDSGFFYLGNLVEFAPTSIIFTNPKDSRTDDYINGRFG